MNEDELRGLFEGVRAPAGVDAWRDREPHSPRRPRPAWSAPVAALVAVMLAAGGLGAYLGLRGTSAPGVARPSGAAGSVTAAGPSPRELAALAYDPANRVVVLFGGQGLLTPLDDTWTWDGGSWTQQHPAHRPPPAAGATMAYDPVSQRVLLVETPGLTATTWTWNGGDWRQLSPGAADPGWSDGPISGMVLDAADGHLLLLSASQLVGQACPPPAPGGPAHPCPAVRSLPQTTWRWDGSSWQRLSETGPPSVASPGLLLTDPASGRPAYVSEPLAYHGCSVPVGTSTGGPQAPARDLHCPGLQPITNGVSIVSRWTGSSWSAAQPVNLALPVTGAAAALDSTAHLDVLRGAGRTLTWDGTRWLDLGPTSGPPTTFSGAAMVYDAARQRTLLLGTLPDGASSTEQTWAWNGASWSLLVQTGGAAAPPPTCPSPHLQSNPAQGGTRPLCPVPTA